LKIASDSKIIVLTQIVSILSNIISLVRFLAGAVTRNQQNDQGPNDV